MTDLTPITPRHQSVTAVLDDAVLMDDAYGSFLSGNVSYDIHQRWQNGERIHTSRIVEKIDEVTFKTKSGSIFRVITWKPEYPLN